MDVVKVRRLVEELAVSLDGGLAPNLKLDVPGDTLYMVIESLKYIRARYGTMAHMQAMYEAGK